MQTMDYMVALALAQIVLRPCYTTCFFHPQVAKNSIIADRCGERQLYNL
jgi:hypothetical protein